MKGYIYKYTFPDGKVYIGQTKNLEKRKRQHIDPNLGPANSGFWAAYCRFGKYDFEVLKVLEYDNEDELNFYLGRWESGYIYQYNATNPDYGYNKMPYAFPKYKSKAILNKKYGEVYQKLLEDRLNIYFNAEHKIWNTHEPLTDEEIYLVTKKYKDKNPFNVRFFDFKNLENNGVLDDYDSDILGHYLSRIYNLIIEEAQDEASFYVGLHRDEILKEAFDKTAIVQIDKDGNVVQEFGSAEEICQKFNVSRADNVRNVLNGKQKTAYGYYWKYKRDLEKKS